MGALSRAAILAANDRPLTPVDVPEWGGSVFVRVMSGAERDSYESGLVGADGKSRDMRNLRARLVVRVACDEAGARLFADEDADALGSKNADALDRIFTAAVRLNQIGAAQVADLGKDSAPTAPGASGSV